MDQVIQAAIQYITTLFEGRSDGHEASHTLRVYQNAKRLAATEEGADMKIVALAAILHDADDHKLFHTENNQNARDFLQEQNIPEDEIERIIHVINGVSFSKNKGKKPDTLEGAIVQDADRLDAIGAIGIARTYAYGGAMGRPIEETRNHFDEKLLLIKDLMNTKSGRAMAEQRHQFMESFLTELSAETMK